VLIEQFEDAAILMMDFRFLRKAGARHFHAAAQTIPV
jgi:hypothetical protein